MVKKIHFNFDIHTPIYLRQFQVFDIGKSSDYWDTKNEAKKFKKLSKLSYRPLFKTFKKLIKKYDLKLSLSFSGLFLDSAKKYDVKLIDEISDLIETGNVELIGGTYFHTLSFLKDKSEFKKEIKTHRKKIKDIFGVDLVSFRNTNFLFYDDLSKILSDVGYENVLVTGDKKIIGDNSSEFVYSSKDKRLNLFFSNINLSNDINHKFSDENWMEYPLKSDKFLKWIESLNGDVLNLFLNSEAFGFSHEKSSKIFEFFENLVSKIHNSKKIDLLCPNEFSGNIKGMIDVKKDFLFNLENNCLSEWLGNKMQENAYDEIYNLKSLVLKTDNKDLINDWKKLQESTNFHFMNKGWADDEKLYKFLNPYGSPYDAFINFNNVLNDLILRSKEIINN